MFVKSKSHYMTMGIIIIIAAALAIVQCARKKQGEGDISHVQIQIGIMKEKLNLNDKQVAEFEKVINEIHAITDKDRNQLKGDDEALIKAARARIELKKSKIESILDEKQKIQFREIMERKKLCDRAILMGERLGLDCDTTEKLNEIVKNGPTDDEAVEIRKSGDIKRIKAFMVSARKLHKKIESLLTDDQIKEFRKMVDEKMALVSKLAKEGS